MKRLVLAALFLFPSLLAAADTNLPPAILCVQVKGLEGRIGCFGQVDYSQFPLDLIKDTIRNAVWFLGFDSANAYFPPPLTTQQEKQKALGQKVMDVALQVAFPELGDAVTKATPAVAYCSSSVGRRSSILSILRYSIRSQPGRVAVQT